MSIRIAVRALMRGVIPAVVFAALTAAPLSAQGKGKGKGHAGGGPAASGSAAPSSTNQAAGFRQFGSWLDDASLLTPGNAWTSISFGHYRWVGGRQTDFPAIDVGVGISKRAQFGISVPYYRVHFTDGTTVGGVGDVFLSGKVMLTDPADGKHAIGLAISPVFEISDDASPGSPPVTWAAPVSIEFRGSRYRLFGSSGYFSRGAVFGSGAVEVPVTDSVIVTSALSLMRSVNDAAAADAMGLSKGRTDVTASAAYFVKPSIAIFGGTGRTIANRDGTGTTLLLNAGISLTFTPRVAP